MKTLLLEKPEQLILCETNENVSLKNDEALVRVRRIGVCGTDIHAFTGKQPFFSYPRILGHELGLEVIAIGSNVSNIKIGDRCSLEPYVNCEKCIACRNGKGNCCVNMQVIGVHTDGGMREQFTVPARKLHPSQKLSYDELALVEPLAIGCHAVERADVKKDEYVLVIGAGPIGLAVIEFAQTKKAKVIVLDVNENRLEFVRQASRLSSPTGILPVESQSTGQAGRLSDKSGKMPDLHTINATKDDVEKKLLEITHGELPTVVFDATGNPKSMMSSFHYPAHGGRLVFVGLFQGDVTFNDPNFHKRELTLFASRNAHSSDFPHIISLIENGEIDVAKWITHRESFHNVPEIFPQWIKPETGVIKAMIEN